MERILPEWDDFDEAAGVCLINNLAASKPACRQRGEKNSSLGNCGAPPPPLEPLDSQPAKRCLRLERRPNSIMLQLFAADVGEHKLLLEFDRTPLGKLEQRIEFATLKSMRYAHGVSKAIITVFEHTSGESNSHIEVQRGSKLVVLLFLGPVSSWGAS